MKHLFWTLAFLFLLPSASAHLEGGQDAVVDDYVIDFGHSPSSLHAGEKATIVLNLVDDATQEALVPTSVWVRIAHENDVVFAGTFHPESESVALTFTFPVPGEYELLARFFDQEALLVEHTFSFPVQGQSDLGVATGSSFGEVILSLYLVVLVVVAIIGMIVLWEAKKKKRRLF